MFMDYEESFFMACPPTPPQTYPPKNKVNYEGLINYWFPLISAC